MILDEKYAQTVWGTRTDLVEKFQQKLEKKYGSHAKVLLEDQEKTLKLFRHWLATSKIL
jgi:hypothetical protein